MRRYDGSAVAPLDLDAVKELRHDGDVFDHAVRHVDTESIVFQQVTQLVAANQVDGRRSIPGRLGLGRRCEASGGIVRSVDRHSSGVEFSPVSGAVAGGTFGVRDAMPRDDPSRGCGGVPGCCGFGGSG